MSISSKNKTATAIVAAMLALGWAGKAEAHHGPSHSAQNVHAAAHVVHAAADVIRAVTGQPAVVPAPAVVAPAAVVTPAVVAPAPAVVTPAVVAPTPVVVPAGPAAVIPPYRPHMTQWERIQRQRAINAAARIRQEQRRRAMMR